MLHEMWPCGNDSDLNHVMFGLFVTVILLMLSVFANRQDKILHKESYS
jgi:hypothetical protein